MARVLPPDIALLATKGAQEGLTLHEQQVLSAYLKRAPGDLDPNNVQFLQSLVSQPATDRENAGTVNPVAHPDYQNPGIQGPPRDLGPLRPASIGLG